MFKVDSKESPEFNWVISLSNNILSLILKISKELSCCYCNEKLCDLCYNRQLKVLYKYLCIINLFDCMIKNSIRNIKNFILLKESQPRIFLRA